MIKFFRKSRQNLLSEGKTVKYFKYTIGEIVLVVIGILIALSINNWNEKQKKQNLKNEYLISLKNDYRNDTIQLNKTIDYNKKRFKVLNQIADEAENTNFTRPEEFISLLKNNTSSIRLNNTYNTNSFRLLISSGNIDLLDKHLQQSIMELNRMQVSEKEITTVNRDYLMTFMSNYRQKYPPETSNKSLNKILWEGIETNEQPKDLLAWLSQERYTIGRYLELREDVLMQTEKVLKLLEEV